jgi:hypothetical protein
VPVSLALPFDGQPQEAVDIDWNNPIAAGLAFAQIGDRAVSVFGARSAMVGNIGRDVGPRGLALDFVGSGPTYVRATDPAISSTGTQLSLVGMSSTSFASTRVPFGLFNVDPSTDPSHKAQYIEYDSTAQVFQATTTDAHNWTSAVGPVTTQPGDYCLAARFTNGGGRDLWQNGELVATNNTARTPTGLDTLQIGMYRSTGGDFFGLSYLHVWWNRLLTDSELRSVSANPWQLFQSPLMAVARYPWTRLVPTSTVSNVGWTPSSGTAHGALAALGGARVTTSTPGALLRVGLG